MVISSICFEDKYDILVNAYNLSRKTNAFIAVDESGKVLSYKYPIPSEEEIKKIMTAISYK
jgi:predicted transcriptional regulator